MEKNIKVELTAYEAASIVSYLQSFVFYEGEHMSGCKNAIESLSGQIKAQWSDEMTREANRDREINKAFGFEP